MKHFHNFTCLIEYNNQENDSLYGILSPSSGEQHNPLASSSVVCFLMVLLTLSLSRSSTTVESLYLEVRGTFVKTSSYRKFDVYIIEVLDAGYESDQWQSTGSK